MTNETLSPSNGRVVLILGASSDVAMEAIRLYIANGYTIIAASRSVDKLHAFAERHELREDRMLIRYFDATAFATHPVFYQELPLKPSVVLYAAGFLKNNEEAMADWEGTFQMMKVHYCGAVSILNIIANDRANGNLEKIIGLSSLSGVRGRKSNFIYGSTKAAFTQYLAGLRQYLAPRKITVNDRYDDSKIYSPGSGIRQLFLENILLPNERWPGLVTAITHTPIQN